MKDPKRCVNDHKYCSPCIYVWSVSGHGENHEKCPVCRVQGYYLLCRELAEKIDRKRVKCHLKNCKWKGPLKNIRSHQHTTYTTYTRTGLPYRPSQREEERYGGTDNIDLPSLPNDINNNEGPSTRRFGEREATIRVIHGRPDDRTPSSIGQSQIHQRQTPSRGLVGLSAGPVSSENEGIPNSVARESSFIGSPRTPRPPSRPRPSGMPTRRMPTLPNIVNQSQNAPRQSTTVNQTQSSSRPSNTVSQSQNTTRQSASVNTSQGATRQSTTSRQAASTNSDMRPHHGTTSMRSRTGNTSENTSPGYRNIRERLRDSRSRLDTLMSTFSTELERGRRDIADFQEQREQRRQEQLEEVRELGRRLGHVATELRGLLEARRQLRSDIDDSEF